MSYFEQLTRAMTLLAEDERTLFVGQSVLYDGQRAHESFSGVPAEKKIEMPITEDFTIGFATGFSLIGFVPLVFLPRWDFTIIGMNQLANHLDKLPLMGPHSAHVIIRTAVGSPKGFDPGPQHVGDYTHPMLQLLKTVKVVSLDEESQILPAYMLALTSPGAWIIVERMEHY